MTMAQTIWSGPLSWGGWASEHGYGAAHTRRLPRCGLPPQPQHGGGRRPRGRRNIWQLRRSSGLPKVLINGYMFLPRAMKPAGHQGDTTPCLRRFGMLSGAMLRLLRDAASSAGPIDPDVCRRAPSRNSDTACDRERQSLPSAVTAAAEGMVAGTGFEPVGRSGRCLTAGLLTRVVLHLVRSQRFARGEGCRMTRWRVGPSGT